MIRRMQQGQNRAPQPMMSIQDAVKLSTRYEQLNTAQRGAVGRDSYLRDIGSGTAGPRRRG